MQPSNEINVAQVLEAEFVARQRDSYAFEGNRHERRAEEVMARRQAAKVVRERTAPVFYGRATSADVITG